MAFNFSVKLQAAPQHMEKVGFCMLATKLLLDKGFMEKFMENAHYLWIPKLSCAKRNIS